MFRIEPIQAKHETAFLEACRRSARHPHPWIAPPRTTRGFRQHLARYQAVNQASYVALADRDNALIGCVHLNEIVHGALESAYLAYFVFVPYQGQGWMPAILTQVIDTAFEQYGLHRLEANIQPENHRSKALVEQLDFRLEGFSPRYLKIGGRWRDHERYAITVEEWRGRRGARA
jgi:ribosomal-protein-alanine N-acetyltransferase